MQIVAHVPAELELAKPLRKVLLARLDVGAVDTALENAPEAQRIDDGSVTANVLLGHSH